MHINDDGSKPESILARRPPAVPALRLVVDNAPSLPERRRAPRRQIAAGRAFERRRGNDRRQRRPGIDGLLRTVLSDNWP